jgi:uncharacterized protein (DUF305 family)
MRLGAGLLALLLLAGCSSEPVAEQGQANADVFFAQRMIEHGTQAVAAAKLVQGRTANKKVLDLARQIQDGTGAEISRLTELAGRLGAKAPAAPASIPGAIDAEDLAQLGGSTGDRFTSQWLDAMIVHHRGAITMAETELSQGGDVDVKTVAQQVVSSRQPQLDEMQGMTGG